MQLLGTAVLLVRVAGEGRRSLPRTWLSQPPGRWRWGGQAGGVGVEEKGLRPRMGCERVSRYPAQALAQGVSTGAVAFEGALLDELG